MLLTEGVSGEKEIEESHLPIKAWFSYYLSTEQEPGSYDLHDGNSCSKSYIDKFINFHCSQPKPLCTHVCFQVLRCFCTIITLTWQRQKSFTKFIMNVLFPPFYLQLLESHRDERSTSGRPRKKLFSWSCLWVGKITLIIKGLNSSTQTGRTTRFHGQAQHKLVRNGHPTTLSGKQHPLAKTYN